MEWSGPWGALAPLGRKSHWLEVATKAHDHQGYNFEASFMKDQGHDNDHDEWNDQVEFRNACFAAAALALVRSSTRAWRVAATRAARSEDAGALAVLGAARAAFAPACARAMFTRRWSAGREVFSQNGFDETLRRLFTGVKGGSLG